MFFWKFKATFRPFLLKNEDFSTFIKHCLKWQSLAVFTVAVAVTVQCDPFSDTVEDRGLWRVDSSSPEQGNDVISLDLVFVA